MHSFNYFAYLDAGTGSLIIQSLIGIVAGVTVFGRRAIGNGVHKVKAIFGRDTETKKPKTQKD